MLWIQGAANPLYLSVEVYYSVSRKNQKSPQIVGTKAADVVNKFFSRQTQYESIEYFGAFATTFISQV